MMLSQLATERAEREAEREALERRMADLIQFVSRMGPKLVYRCHIRFSLHLSLLS